MSKKNSEKTIQEILSSNTYTCWLCKQEFEKEWSDTEAIAEKESYWGEIPLENCKAVCDDCWNKIKPY